MLYNEIRIRRIGESGLTVEYGDEANLALNFQVIALMYAIQEKAAKGILETVPTMRSLGIFYNPFIMDELQAIAEIQKIEINKGKITELPSRLIKIPVWYNDPWSAECAEYFGVRNNIEFVAEHNNMTIDEFIQAHSGVDWWVTEVGFSPGTYNAYPLDPSVILTAPKYLVPRTWSPIRTICLGGRATGEYPVRSPGGYQLIGRSPANFYEPYQLNPTFRDDPILTRPGDRHRYVPITENEYYTVREMVNKGEYSHEVEEGVFNLLAYFGRDRAHQEQPGRA
jgi:KipI family sensor histidine kinase inhibitor